MLSALVRVIECRIAQELCDAWAAHLALVKQEVGEAERRIAGTKVSPGYGPDPRTSVTRGAHRAGSRLLKGLRPEALEARQAQKECATAVDDLTANLGEPLDEPEVNGRVQGAFVLDSLAPLRDQLRAAQQRFDRLMAQDRALLHDLALQEGYRRSSEGHAASIPLRAVDSMAQGAFADLVEALLRRDGYQTQRPAGAGADHLIMASQADCSLIVSALRVDGPDTWRLDPKPADDITTLALHGVRHLTTQRAAEHLVVVTNGGFSLPARRYAAKHRIVLLGRDLLQRWAEWQEPFEFTDRCEQETA
ncbi:restriction endonuclease [Streptomyces roseoverticillatus]|uniref:restriction endonuclease n=1 Tax=Streptomyces roseoverticillatus TaxID=66429 RepID=UPI001F482077|nr:restriction endonuclease [Streptomyces roseoverticillatus]MCF3105349.1 restriction endonuclease [Streptomyces roseoverticillatus]